MMYGSPAPSLTHSRCRQIFHGMWHLSTDAYEYFKRQFPDDDDVVPASARISRLHQDESMADVLALSGSTKWKSKVLLSQYVICCDSPDTITPTRTFGSKSFTRSFSSLFAVQI